ncbi:hypothetical protein EV649_8016 [Kribbella sp. VKM Ac-2569]|uniref:hypothetical protein n=1 Tax=Kribbella sp. VKM Ac-2569 TaxID=2512220 RepID=UPI00102BAD54|nr:hypothetical protein [Kribbella sp. VKM Ac-2569]RZT07601.1 hypothetical protein EV649_8016 [Kribbella sp. VKM Ac-2569]
MKDSRSRWAGVLPLAALLAAGLGAGPASASPVVAPAGAQQVTAACKMSVGSVTDAGDHYIREYTATSPPSMTGETRGLLATVLDAGMAGSMVKEPVAAGSRYSGWMVFGNVMWAVSYEVDAQNKPIAGTTKTARVGGGWDGYSYFETSRTTTRTNQYALRSDGTLLRWTMSGSTWAAKVSAPGFSSVRAMALISQTSAYDTFLATTRGGALYSVRVPTTGAFKPVVRLVGAAGSRWEKPINLVAERCGQYGTLLVGIDRNGQNAEMFAIGHVNGTATVINELHWVEAEFADPVYFRMTGRPDLTPPLNGE